VVVTVLPAPTMDLVADLADADEFMAGAPIAAADDSVGHTDDLDVSAAQTDQPIVGSAPDALAAQLSHLIESVAVVEDLSRQAREAAVGDLARYEVLVASAGQYGRSLEQARVIRDQARDALGRAFGQAARAVAEPLVAEAERVLAAFDQLVNAWQEQAGSFLAAHPDVELLVVEQRAQEAEARQREARAAQAQRRDSLLASVDAALDERVLPEARRALALVEREFPGDTEAVRLRQQRLQQAVRAEKDFAARQALLLAADQHARGDLESAVATLEQVDVQGLSLDVSEDVFGRWCDACSRLAQTTGAWLVRYAPAQGRGLILLKDPARPNELQVFSSLGMGTDYPQGVVIGGFLDDQERRDPGARKRAEAAPMILRRAREFREATAEPVSSWGSFATSPQPPAPIHH
jgi:hypothetical protein